MASGEAAQAATTQGRVTCSAWIRRKEGKNNSDNKLLVVTGRSATASVPAVLELSTFDPKTSSLSSDPLVLPPFSFQSSLTLAPRFWNEIDDIIALRRKIVYYRAYHFREKKG